MFRVPCLVSTDRQATDADLMFLQGNHGTRFQIVLALCNHALQQSGKFTSAQAFNPHTYHRWLGGLGQGEMRMKIGVQSHDHSLLLNSPTQNFYIGSLGLSNFASVDSIKPSMA